MSCHDLCWWFGVLDVPGGMCSREAEQEAHNLPIESAIGISHAHLMGPKALLLTVKSQVLLRWNSYVDNNYDPRCRELAIGKCSRGSD